MTFQIIAALTFTGLSAQEWMRVHQQAFDTPWTLPVAIDSIEEMRVEEPQELLDIEMHDAFVVPLGIGGLDSLSFEEIIESETKNKYQVFQLFIYTENGQGIYSKDDYVPCYVGINGGNSYSCRWQKAGIRGRGNSTWEWYDKKPYRIKFDTKQKVLGMSRAKSWVLLANYRDVTDMMNTYVFELGQMMGLPFTNHCRYVEVLLNGEYIGLYQLTEQVQQGSNRVDISDDRGILLSLDVDDGPQGGDRSERSFWTKGYQMPAVVKYPDEEVLTPALLDSIREVFGQLESAIKQKNYAAASELLDMESFARYVMIQELVYNVELSAPRSIYLHKDGDGKWVMGPLWDFDAGYDFDWADMYHGHDYFASYQETVMGSNPVKRNGNYKDTPQFFTDLFGTQEFVDLYKETWQQYADSIVSRPWEEVIKYMNQFRQGAITRENQKWPIRNKSFGTELNKMHEWLLNRAAFMDDLVRNIPDPGNVVPIDDEKLKGTIDVYTTMQWNKGYDQDVKVEVDRSKVLQLLGLAEADFKKSSMTIVPLNSDGTEGPNNTNGTFGGWFDGDNNPRTWNGGHIYIEVFDDLFNWDCGLRNDTCYDDEHTVTMQYQYQVGTTLYKVNVRVHFTIEFSWW
ncbi:MAG: CotH kinase family protein [Bacteroidaceae bacterium]|nr:CotH kinase family protein [Bacteroidaceae bacterium]